MSKGLANSFNLFTSDYYAKLKAEGKQGNLQEAAKLWKEFGEEDKKKWQQLSKKNREEKAKRLAEGIVDEKPKRGPGSYNFWQKENAEEIKQKLEGLKGDARRAKKRELYEEAKKDERYLSKAAKKARERSATVTSSSENPTKVETKVETKKAETKKVEVKAEPKVETKKAEPKVEPKKPTVKLTLPANPPKLQRSLSVAQPSKQAPESDVDEEASGEEESDDE